MNFVNDGQMKLADILRSAGTSGFTVLPPPNGIPAANPILAVKKLQGLVEVESTLDAIVRAAAQGARAVPGHSKKEDANDDS